MEFSIKRGRPERLRAGCIIVGVFAPRKLTAAGATLDHAARGYLRAMLKRGDMDGKAGRTLLLHQVPHAAADRVLLVGLGRERDFGDRQFRDAVHHAVRALDQGGVADAVLCLSAGVKGRDSAWLASQAVMVASDTSYRFDRMKSKRDGSRGGLRRLTMLVTERAELHPGELALKRGIAISHGVNLAKDLGNLPANICTPAYLAEAARARWPNNTNSACKYWNVGTWKSSVWARCCRLPAAAPNRRSLLCFNTTVPIVSKNRWR